MILRVNLKQAFFLKILTHDGAFVMLGCKCGKTPKPVAMLHSFPQLCSSSVDRGGGGGINYSNPHGGLYELYSKANTTEWS